MCHLSPTDMSCLWQVSAHLSGNNCLGCAAGSDLQKWAAAEKFQPSSKSSGHLNGTGQKVHSLVDSEKPSNQSSAIIVKPYTSRLLVSDPDLLLLHMDGVRVGALCSRQCTRFPLVKF